MRIAIIGAGAMGCLFAARLILRGARVTLIEADSKTIAAIHVNGIRLVMSDDTQCIDASIHQAAQLRERFDLLIILTKATATATAIGSASHLIAPETRVLTLQNGLGNAELIAAYAPARNILVGVTTIAADLVAPGVVHSNFRGSIHLGSYQGGSDYFLQRLNEMLCEAGFDSRLDPAIDSRIWEKAAFNAALNALCTILDLPVGAVGMHANGRRLVELVVQECGQVAQQAGVPFDSRRVLNNIAHAFDHQPEHMPSMLQDRRVGKPTEVESIQGAILHQAWKHGTSTPILETLYSLLRIGEP